MKVAILYILLASYLPGQMTGREIMEKVDIHPEPEDMVSTTTMTLIKTVGEREKRRMREVTRYQKFYPEGEFSSKSLVRFLKPPDVEGTGFLLWEYREPGKDDDQWLYLPALKKVKRIVARQKSESFMGTDFTYEDLARREIDEDTYELIGEEVAFDRDCYKVEAIPREKGSNYSKTIVLVSKDQWLVRKVEYYDRKGRLLKILEIPEIRKDGAYWTTRNLVMENVQKSHRTVLDVSDVTYDSGIDDHFFTERFLKRSR
ncbi:MAG: outer membrane lipoprotein-sorting protein [Candidatus Neomarinimicrobiota bacterium]